MNTAPVAWRAGAKKRQRSQSHRQPIYQHVARQTTRDAIREESKRHPVIKSGANMCHRTLAFQLGLCLANLVAMAWLSSYGAVVLFSPGMVCHWRGWVV